jgi:hypothetical protein
MSNDAVSNIPYVPENVDDVAAATNQAITAIGALLCPPVISRTETAPPTTANDGDCYIPASPASGAWAGLEDHLVRYVADGDYWLSYAPGNVRLCIDMASSPPSLIFWGGEEWLSA